MLKRLLDRLLGPAMFRRGDVVRLKSGIGPVMVVARGGRLIVRCVYFDDGGRLRRARLRCELLFAPL